MGFDHVTNSRFTLHTHKEHGAKMANTETQKIEAGETHVRLKPLLRRTGHDGRSGSCGFQMPG